MHKPLSAVLIILGTTFTGFAHAEPATAGVAIPANVISNILKRHPQAQDLQASHETHFGQKLLEVRFKDDKGQELMELFNAKDHLYTNEVLVEDLHDLFPPVLASLKQAFPEHTLQKAELIANPNGGGEEYEVYLTAGGQNWKVFLDGHGTIQSKESLNP